MAKKPTEKKGKKSSAPAKKLTTKKTGAKRSEKGSPADPQLPSPEAEVRGMEPEISGARPVQEYTAAFPVSHGQFFLHDDWSDCDIEWDEETIANRFVCASDPADAVAVGTVDYGARVTLTLVVGRPCPPEELHNCRHVVEGPLAIGEGTMLVNSLPAGDALRIAVPPGTYRLCVLYYCWNHKDGDTDPGNPEPYKIYMWPAEFAPPKVLKRAPRKW